MENTEWYMRKFRADQSEVPIRVKISDENCLAKHKVMMQQITQLGSTESHTENISFNQSDYRSLVKTGQGSHVFTKEMAPGHGLIMNGLQRKSLWQEDR